MNCVINNMLWCYNHKRWVFIFHVVFFPLFLYIDRWVPSSKQSWFQILSEITPVVLDTNCKNVHNIVIKACEFACDNHTSGNKQFFLFITSKWKGKMWTFFLVPKSQFPWVKMHCRWSDLKPFNIIAGSLPHQVKVKTQYLHFRFHAIYFLLTWKNPEEISRRSMLFHN